MLGERPSSRTAPSIWYALVAAPHRNPSGKRVSVVAMPRALLRVSRVRPCRGVPRAPSARGRPGSALAAAASLVDRGTGHVGGRARPPPWWGSPRSPARWHRRPDTARDTDRRSDREPRPCDPGHPSPWVADESSWMTHRLPAGPAVDLPDDEPRRQVHALGYGLLVVEEAEEGVLDPDAESAGGLAPGHDTRDRRAGHTARLQPASSRVPATWSASPAPITGRKEPPGEPATGGTTSHDHADHGAVDAGPHALAGAPGRTRRPALAVEPEPGHPARPAAPLEQHLQLGRGALRGCLCRRLPGR